MTVPVTNGGKKAHNLRHERRDDKAEEPGGDGRAEDALQADPRHAGHGDHAADGGETGAHHHRHANAYRADAERLHQGGDTGDEQVGVDQKGDFFTAQAGGLANDQGDGDGAAVHQQDVLQAYQNQLQEGQPHHGGCGGNLRFD